MTSAVSCGLMTNSCKSADMPAPPLMVAMVRWELSAITAAPSHGRPGVRGVGDPDHRDEHIRHSKIALLCGETPLLPMRGWVASGN